MPTIDSIPTISPTYYSTGSDQTIWTAWNGTTSGTATAVSQIIWTAWNTSLTGTSTTAAYTLTNQAIWNNWNVRYAPTLIASHLRNDPPEVVQARLREAEERQAARRARDLEIVGERKLARERAALLLNENLSEAQRLELRDKGYFSLKVIDSQTLAERYYRIHKGRSRNVRQVDRNGNHIKTLCAHPIIGCPDEDTMLAQKLMLETQESEFLRIANHS